MMYSYATNSVLSGAEHQFFTDHGEDLMVISLNHCNINDVKINGYWRGSKIQGYNMWSHMAGDNFVLEFADYNGSHKLEYFGSGHYELDGVRAKNS